MARLNYKELLELYMAHVDGNAGETFVERRDGADWTDKEWAALIEIRNRIEQWNYDDEQACHAAKAAKEAGETLHAVQS
jgi:hypothetical protein